MNETTATDSTGKEEIHPGGGANEHVPGPPMDDVVLKVDNLVKDYGPKRVLDGVNLFARKGEVLVLMGGSGAGKSTIFRCVIGATDITSGNIWIDGTDITTVKTDTKYDEIRKKYGVSFQNAALFNSMTIGENVSLPLRQHTQLDEDTIEIMVKMKLEQVGLRDAEDLYPSQISGGMQKRAA
ncbi:ABC transporter ATP-binding protein, partial [Planctomycetota bacterium]